MAAAVDPEVTHGPLEILLTVEEEIGLLGASHLDPSLLDGRLLVNLDSEEEGAVYIGCAGAAGVDASIPVARVDADDRPLFELAVSGCRGGHSGMEIHLDGANAIKLAARLLVTAMDGDRAEEDAGGGSRDLGLVSFVGGDKSNAIPRECVVGLRLDELAEQAVGRAVERWLTAWRTRHRTTDFDLDVRLTRVPADTGARVLDADSAGRWLRLLDASPHGPLAISRDVPDLVETSINLAKARLTDGATSGHVHWSARSSVNPALDATVRSTASLARLAGGRAQLTGGYPGWTPDPASALVRRTMDVHQRIFGREPAMKAIHAGLECGILAQKVPGLDAVSFGPDLHGAHSPQERVSIPSVARTWRLLVALLADLCR
jgi:dipeptidase D